MDGAAFAELVEPYRAELFRHCYRMTGSVQDAEDALQESLLGAWRGLPGFDGRASLRTWLHTIAAHACLRLIERRPRRLLSAEHGPALRQTAELGEPVEGPVWLEPFPELLAPAGTGPEESYDRRESVELAYVAALQHLPGSQRAVLILREVLRFSTAEVAQMLDSSVPAVNSALQRARATLAVRAPDRSQRAELADLGEDGLRDLVDSFVIAWQRADVPALLALLTADARFTMPPLPAWFDGPEWIGRFWVDRMFVADWRLLPVRANGQLAFACYQGPAFALSSVLLLTLRGGRIAELTGFLDPALHVHFGLPASLSAGDR